MLEVISAAESRVLVLAAEFATSWQRTLDLAIELGQALIELKDRELKHGQFLPWLDQNFPGSVAMADRFMRLARNSSDLTNLPPHTSVDGALAWLAEQRKGPRALPEAIDPPSMDLLRFCQADLPTAMIVSLILQVFFPDAETALDLTYGSGAFWDGSAHVQVTAVDVDPQRGLDGTADFLAGVPFTDDSYDVVLADPPHLADAGDDSIMGTRFGTYTDAELPKVIRAAACEAWRCARLGVVIKIADSVHGQRYVLESDWVREAIGQAPYDVVYQTRSSALVDPRWERQLSARNNGATYLIFRKGDQRHIPRGQA